MHSKNTIWLVNLFFGLGTSPTGVLLESLALALQKDGYNVEVLTGNVGYNQTVGNTTRRFIGKVHFLPAGWNAQGILGRLLGWVIFYCSVCIFSLLSPLPRKVVMMTTPPYLHLAFVLCKWLKRSNTELVLWSQDVYPEILAAVGLLKPTSIFYLCLVAVQRFGTSRIDKTIVLDRAMENILRNYGSRKIRLIPNWGIEFSNASATLPADLDLVIRNAKIKYQNIVLYTGNYGWGHDISIILQYVEKHCATTRFFFLFVGGGEKWQRLLDLERMHPEWPMKVWAYVSKEAFPKLLAEANIGLVALENHCVGLMSPSKIHAYLLQGLPLLYLGPSGSNVSDAIADYECGYSVKPNDLAMLEMALTDILTNSNKLPRMADNAVNAGKVRYSEHVGTAVLTKFIAE